MEKVKPEIGMGATECMFTDRHPYTIIDISKSGRVITVQRDTATRTDLNGMSSSQVYTYTSNPDGTIKKLSFRKNGQWRVVNSSEIFVIGSRREYYDYSF